METETTNTDPSNRDSKQKFRRKNKKNKFLSNAKGFGKRGIFGRGTNIVDDEFTYFVNILDAMKTGFESADEKAAMANNVFDQTVDKEIHLSSNQIVSKCIEMLIGFTDEEHFEKFMKSFSENFRPICSDCYASHVLQKMIEIAFLRAVGHQPNNTDIENNVESPEKKLKPDLLIDKEFNLTENFNEKHRLECSSFVLKISKFLLNNLEDFVWDQFASHIMRTSILSLSGIHAAKIAFDQNKDITKNSTIFVVPKEWTDVVREFANRLELWPQFSEFPYSELSSALLGCICVSLRQIDKNLLKHFGKKILVESFLKVESIDDEDKKKIVVVDDEITEQDDQNNSEMNGNIEKVAKVFETASSIRLLETLLLVAGPKLFTQLYAMLFPCKLKILALDRSTNFAVQKIIENVKEKTDFESIFIELSDHIEELLKVGHSGIVFALAKTCLRLQTKQGAFVVAMQNALHTTGSKEKSETIFICLVKLKPYEIIINDDKSNTSLFVHLHGSLIIQNILKFNKPIFLVNCLLNHNANDLAGIFSTPNGSHIVDAFMDSKFIGEKSREKLIRSLEGTYLDMAITKFGSRTIDKLFEFSNEQQKSRIVKELADQMNRLNGTMFGRVICNKFRIETFKLSPTQWKAAFDRANKAEKLFKEIIE